MLPLALSACSGVKIKPDETLPKPLVEPLPASVGLVLPDELRNYQHKETRFGTDWLITLGPGHVHLMEQIFKDSFANVQEFHDRTAAAAAADLQAVFEPHIEGYQFVTSRETNGRYCAVSIRYRFFIYTPKGEKADTLTLTGYGSALASSTSGGGPLEAATLAAMRDAAAKFLVQFPDQPAAQPLAHHQPLSVQQAAAVTGNDLIQAVPIEESEDVAASVKSAPAAAPAAAPGTAPPAPAATPQTPSA